MNLQTIQKRVEELSAELLTLSNDLAFIVSGNISRDQSPVINRDSAWADGLRAGDTVKCVAIHSINDTRLRCFTLGNLYTVESRLRSTTPGDSFYGIRVLRDDENEGHDARDVIFVKVG